MVTATTITVEALILLQVKISRNGYLMVARCKVFLNCVSVFIFKVKEACNLNLEDIVTPVKHEILDELLTATGYDMEKKTFLINGFRNGFHYNMKAT